MNKSHVQWNLCLILTLSFLTLSFLSAVPAIAQPVSAADEHAGKLLVEGSWRTPEEIGHANQHNRVLNQYLELRSQTPDTFEGQTRLAHWCYARSLTDRRDAHLQRALVHNPDNRRVRGLLGHVNVDGEWYTAEQIENRERENVAARTRYRDWRAPVNKIARQLRSRNERHQKQGAESLREIRDPRSVTALEAILAPINESVATQAVDAINRFPQREATKSIARIALFNPHEPVREHALDVLAQRNRYDYIPDLVRELASPVSTRVSIIPDASGNVLYRYVLFQQRMDKDYIRQFDRWMLQDPRTANAAAQGILAGRASTRAGMANSQIEQLNEFIHKKNSLIQYSLRRTTSDNPGESPEDWWQWWYDDNDVYLAERPVSYVLVEEAEVSSIPQTPSGGECLVAGTPVWTDMGPKPVETLQIGDLVLCQDPESSKLEYRAVLYPTTRPETPTFQMLLNDEMIQASGGHLFWVNGSGWMKTRDLCSGMTLRTANDSQANILHIQPADAAPLYNLVVDGCPTYFVGKQMVLSHDSTILAHGERSVEQKVEQEESSSNETKQENGVLLKDAVKAFNDRYQNMTVATFTFEAAPLTVEEVLIKLEKAKTQRKKELAYLTDEQFEQFIGIATTKRLPPDFKLEPQMGFQPTDLVHIRSWAIRIFSMNDDHTRIVSMTIRDHGEEPPVPKEKSRN